MSSLPKRRTDSFGRLVRAPAAAPNAAPSTRPASARHQPRASPLSAPLGPKPSLASAIARHANVKPVPTPLGATSSSAPTLGATTPPGAVALPPRPTRAKADVVLTQHAVHNVVHNVVHNAVHNVVHNAVHNVVHNAVHNAVHNVVQHALQPSVCTPPTRLVIAGVNVGATNATSDAARELFIRAHAAGVRDSHLVAEGAAVTPSRANLVASLLWLTEGCTRASHLTFMFIGSLQSGALVPLDFTEPPLSRADIHAIVAPRLNGARFTCTLATWSAEGGWVQDALPVTALRIPGLPPVQPTLVHAAVAKEEAANEDASALVQSVVEAVLRDDAPALVEPVVSDDAPALVEPVVSDDAPALVEPVVSNDAPALVEPVVSDDAPALVEPVVSDDAPATVTPAEIAEPALVQLETSDDAPLISHDEAMQLVASARIEESDRAATPLQIISDDAACDNVTGSLNADSANIDEGISDHDDERKSIPLFFA